LLQLDSADEPLRKLSICYATDITNNSQIIEHRCDRIRTYEEAGYGWWKWGK